MGRHLLQPGGVEDLDVVVEEEEDGAGGLGGGIVVEGGVIEGTGGREDTGAGVGAEMGEEGEGIGVGAAVVDDEELEVGVVGLVEEALGGAGEVRGVVAGGDDDGDAGGGGGDGPGGAEAGGVETGGEERRARGEGLLDDCGGWGFRAGGGAVGEDLGNVADVFGTGFEGEVGEGGFQVDLDGWGAGEAEGADEVLLEGEVEAPGGFAVGVVEVVFGGEVVFVGVEEVGFGVGLEFGEEAGDRCWGDQDAGGESEEVGGGAVDRMVEGDRSDALAAGLWLRGDEEDGSSRGGGSRGRPGGGGDRRFGGG